MTSSEKDKIDGAKLIRAILENMHDSLKWLWLIIMGFSLVNAIEVYVKLLSLEKVTNPYDLLRLFLVAPTLVFFSFILVFIRFYLGDSRFLDLSYKETQYSRGLGAELKKYSGRKRATDIMLLLSHGIFFYFMSFHIGNAYYYVYFFIILMVVNVIWLWLQILARIGSNHYKGPDELIGGMDGTKVLIIWSINNLIFAVVLILTVFSDLPQVQSFFICIGLTILNSIIDFRFTWNYYFPPYHELYKQGKIQV